MTRRQLYFGLLVLWVAVTFLLTSIPNPPVIIPVPYADKVAHFSFYGVMGFFCALWRRESGSATAAAVVTAMVFVAFVGAVDEVHQHWIPGRSMDVVDWVADATGGVAGAFASVFLPLLLPFLLTE